MYGHGEVAQALCRVCAVHGGVYVLRCPVSRVYVPLASEDNSGAHWNVGIATTDGKFFRTKAVLAGPAYALAKLLPDRGMESTSSSVDLSLQAPSEPPLLATQSSRFESEAHPVLFSAHEVTSSSKQYASALGVCILVSPAPILMMARNAVAYAILPPMLAPMLHDQPVYVMQQGFVSGAAPQGYYTIHAWTHALYSSEEASSGVGREVARSDAVRACTMATDHLLQIAASGHGVEVDKLDLWRCALSFALTSGTSDDFTAAQPAAPLSSGCVAASRSQWVSTPPTRTASLHDEDSVAAAMACWTALYPDEGFLVPKDDSEHVEKDSARVEGAEEVAQNGGRSENDPSTGGDVSVQHIPVNTSGAASTSETVGARIIDFLAPASLAPVDCDLPPSDLVCSEQRAVAVTDASTFDADDIEAAFALLREADE
jgi:hypothetical protein